jgi:putative inorganic carbon (HCO3(-)) transporter
VIQQLLKRIDTRKSDNWYWGFLILFILINSWLTADEFYYFPVLPLVVLIIFSALVALDRLIFFILFCIPLSLTLEFSEFAALTVPTEPLLFGVMLVFLFRLMYEGGFDIKITKHPVTLAILFHLVWMFITSLSSTMVLVSVKYFVARLWFVISFYFLATQIFKRFDRIITWIWLFTVPLSIVICYSIVQFFNYNIDKDALYWVMQPFFKDHTIYGAVIAMMLPLMFVFSFDKSYTPKYRFISFGFFLVIFIGIIVSYTRAAWLSVAGAYFVYLIYLLRINWKIVLVGFVLSLGVLGYYSDEIKMKFAANKQSSSQDLGEHLKSVSNIKSDASNMERINRWSSALRMFRNKPILGFGPGTYRFQYAPFQRSYELTYVSTNAGSLGNAHSEYLGPLAEQGLLGTISFVLIVVLTIATGTRIYFTSKSRQIRFLSMGALIGLFTYFLHGFLNNFLDQDKASAPFWSLIAILVALDVYHRKHGLPQKNSEDTLPPPETPVQ